VNTIQNLVTRTSSQPWCWKSDFYLRPQISSL